MKSYLKIKIILVLITFGIIFAFMPIITTNLSLITDNMNKISDRKDGSNLNNNNLKASKVSAPIYIDDTDPNYNWTVTKDAGICTGNGTYSEPYIIEDLVIDGGGSGSCIWIENSNVYFKIENCTLYNAVDYPHAGIRLYNVTKGNLVLNNCTSSCEGIYIAYCDNNTISGNTANYNVNCGILLLNSNYHSISENTANNNPYGIHLFTHCAYNNISRNIVNNNHKSGINLSGDHNNISGNTANNNEYGIELDYSNNNEISGNTANNNDYCGMYFVRSNYNTVSGNILLGNSKCICEYRCKGNVFENNDCGIPFELIILISSISGGAVIVGVAFLLIKRKRKRIS